MRATMRVGYMLLDLLVWLVLQVLRACG